MSSTEVNSTYFPSLIFCLLSFTFTALGLLADVMLPLWWALAATVPIIFASWWVAYRSDWF